MGNKNIKKTLATLRFLDIFDQGGNPGGFSKFIIQTPLSWGIPLKAQYRKYPQNLR